MKKKKKNSYLKLGLSTIIPAVAVGSIPNVSGTAAETNIKSSYVSGLGNIAGTFPAQGKLIGASMVIKQVKKLSKKTK